MNWNTDDDNKAQSDEQADRETLKAIDRYFDRCFHTDPEGLKLTDYRFRLSPFDIQDDFCSPSVKVAPVITFVNEILSRAIQHKAQQVRLVPLSTQTLIRFNRGEGFYERFPDLPQVIMGALANRIRLIAGMALMARNKPVIGKMRLCFRAAEEDQAEQIDQIDQIEQTEQHSILTVYTYPSTYGESMLLKSENTIVGLRA